MEHSMEHSDEFGNKNNYKKKKKPKKGHSGCLGPGVFLIENSFFMHFSIQEEVQLENGPLVFDINTDFGPFMWPKSDFTKESVKYIIPKLSGFVHPDFINHVFDHGFCWVLKLKVAK